MPIPRDCMSTVHMRNAYVLARLVGSTLVDGIDDINCTYIHTCVHSMLLVFSTNI